jgi:ribosome-associated protein
MIQYKLTSEYIELIKLLKLFQIAESGGQAKILVDEGMVFLNGKREFRKRAKLRPGDQITVLNKKIMIT